MIKLLFICRKYNDLDHSSPLIYKFLQLKKYKIDFLNINLNQSFSDDFKIKFFKKKYKSRFREINFNKFYNTSKINNFYINLLSVKKNEDKKFIYVLKYFLFKFKFHNFLINRLIKSNINISTFYKAIIFDHLDLKKTKLLNIIFLRYKKKYNTKFISIPHGFSTNSKSVGIDKIKRVFIRLINFCDLSFFSNKLWFKELLEKGVDKNKAKNYGSLRFNRFWSKFLLNISRNNKNSFKTKKIKVLILGFEKARIREKNFHEMFQNTLDIISENKNFEVIFKPATRTNTIKFATLPKNFKLSFDHTVPLIRDSDIVIGHNSGVVFEVFLQNKQYISLRYLRPFDKIYDNVFEKYNVCFSPRTFNQFKQAINKKDKFNFINKKNQERFIKVFLNHNSNPFKDYFREIDKLLN